MVKPLRVAHGPDALWYGKPGYPRLNSGPSQRPTTHGTYRRMASAMRQAEAVGGVGVRGDDADGELHLERTGGRGATTAPFANASFGHR